MSNLVVCEMPYKRADDQPSIKRYPAELLNTFDVLDNPGIVTPNDGHRGVKRILRKRTRGADRSATKSKGVCTFGHFGDEVSQRKRRDDRGSSVGSSLKGHLFKCPVCRDVLDNPVTATCGHTFCKSCVGLDDKNKCLECAADLDQTSILSTNILVRDIVEKWKKAKRVDFDLEKYCEKKSSRYSLRSKCMTSPSSECIFDTNGKIVNNSLRKRFRSLEDDEYLSSNDLECILCSQCLLDPVTTSCGHTFCRECLARVLDHGLACPLCMSPLQASEQLRGQTAVLGKALSIIGTDESLTERGLSEKENSQIPIFVCINAFPKVACPLFVYEPRYRLLSRRCVQSSSKIFGMAAKALNGEQFASYGTLMEVRDSITLEDGSSIVTAMGLRRFKVTERGYQDGYDTASVQYIQDCPVSTKELSTLSILHLRAYTKAVRWVKSLNSRLLAEIERCIGPMPQVEKKWSTFPDGPAWTWWMIAILPMSSQLRVGFLSSTSLEKRLRAIKKMLEHLLTKLEISLKAKHESSDAPCQFRQRL